MGAGSKCHCGNEISISRRIDTDIIPNKYVSSFGCQKLEGKTLTHNHASVYVFSILYIGP